MPKIIDNIEEKIYNSAFELFTHKGYDSVNMKMVAEKSGIAVGTLYNYHDNKKQLYMDVFKNSWEETFEKLNKVLKEKDDSEKLKALIEVLYTEISNRKGFAQELMRSSELQKLGMKIVEKLKSELSTMIKDAVISYEKKEDIRLNEERRQKLVQLIFMDIIILSREFSQDKQKNLNLIMERVKPIIQ